MAELKSDLAPSGSTVHSAWSRELRIACSGPFSGRGTPGPVPVATPPHAPDYPVSQSTGGTEPSNVGATRPAKTTFWPSIELDLIYPPKSKKETSGRTSIKELKAQFRAPAEYLG